MAHGMTRPTAPGDDEHVAEVPRPAKPRPGAAIPLVVWTITAVYVAALLAYSILLPTYQAPDEPQHTDLAHLFATEHRYPAWNDRNLDIGIARSLGWMHFADKSEHLTVSQARPKGEVPAIEDLSDPTRQAAPNYMPQHPPLYYVAAGSAGWLAERVLGSPMGSFIFENWLYRLVSVAFVAPLPLIVWHLASMLRLPRAVGISAALVPLAIPQLLHNGSAVNNDSLMWLLFWLLTPVVLRLAGGDLRPRTAVLAGGLSGLALLTKGFALVLPAWVLAGIVLAVRRGPGGWRSAIRPTAIYAGTSLAVGGWWWVRNLVVYGDLAPSRLNTMLREETVDKVGLLGFVREWGMLTTRRFWGDFGWYYVRLPGVAVVAATTVVVVALALVCSRHDRVGGTRRGDRLLLAAPFVLLVSTQAANALRGHLETGRMQGLQGRYWFGALAGLAIAVALGLANLTRRRLDLLPLGVLAGAAVMQVLAVRAILGFYWGAPASSLADRLRAVVAWAPVQGEVVGIGAVIAALLITALSVQLSASLRRGPQTPALVGTASVGVVTPSDGRDPDQPTMRDWPAPRPVGTGVHHRRSADDE